ncbi:MAG: LysR family transcriptional regulator [Pseudomonadota bacterium]
MRIEDLNYFLAVAETGHVGRASERLGQSQPALTKGIQRLERELQLQLFDRTAKGMELTSPGQAFFQRARHVRTSLDDAIKEANDLHLGKIGLVRVGVAPSHSELFFGSACAALLQQRPAARVKVTIGLNDQLLAALQFGDLDMAISALPSQELTDFVQQPLFQDDLQVVARDDHPLLRADRLRFADLADASWVLPGSNVAARRSIEARFAEHGMPPPNVVVECNSSVTSLASVVQSTDLLTLLPESVLRKAPGAGLAPLGLPETRWPRTVGITTRRGAYLSPLAERLVELLRGHGPG